MASYYTRPDSPFYWVRFQKHDGTWGAKSSGIRTDAEGAARKIRQIVAENTLREYQLDAHSAAHRFNAWVPAFLAQRYTNAKTLTRYLNAWSALVTYLDHRGVIAPSQVTYQLCQDYPRFRTEPPHRLIRRRSWNTALTELKVFSAIMQEAARRAYVPANPCLRMGLKRTPPKQKPEISAEEEAVIETALLSRESWMRDCWLVAMRQGCRLSETAVPLLQIDTADKKNPLVTFTAKGGRLHTAPLHIDLLPLVAAARKAKRKTLVELPSYPAKKWHQFFKCIGLPHLSFHATRVTVVTRLVRAGHAEPLTQAYVGHASTTVHRIYQRLKPADVRSLGAVLSNPSAETQDAAATIPAPIPRSKRRRASETLPTSSV